MCSPLHACVFARSQVCTLCLPGVFVFAVEQRAARTTGTCERCELCVSVSLALPIYDVVIRESHMNMNMNMNMN